MLTPLDIQNKEFRKGIRGYKEVEVDSFLDEVISDYEQIYKENKNLKSKIEMLNEQLTHYDSIEDTLQKTLVVAQTTAEDVVFNARKKADIIIDEANNRAERIVDSAKDQVIDIKKEYENMKQEIFAFNTKYKSLLSSQLETIESYSKEDYKFESKTKRKEENYEFNKEVEIKTKEKNSEELRIAKDLTESKELNLMEDIQDLSNYGNQPLVE